MKKYLLWATMSAAAALAVAGCGSEDESPAGSTTASSGKPVKIALIHYSLNDYNRAEVTGLKKGVEPDGGSVTFFNANFDAQKQLQQCQDAVVSKRFNVIALGPVTPPTGVSCVQVAKAAGIPVIAIESPVGTSVETFAPQVEGVVGSVVASVPSNDALMVELVGNACKGLDPCKIIGEVASPNDPYSNGALKAIKKSVPNVEVVQTIVGQFDPAKLAKDLPAVLAAHPDADVFASSSDHMAVAAVPVLKQAGLTGKIKLVGGGGSRQGVAAVKDGSLYGNYGNWPETMGMVAAKMATQVVNGQPVEPNAVDAYKLGEPAIITKENADQFKAEWGPAPGGS